VDPQQHKFLITISHIYTYYKYWCVTEKYSEAEVSSWHRLCS